MRSAEFGLYDKWIEMSKQQFFKWRFAMKQSGIPVSPVQEVLIATYVGHFINLSYDLSNSPQVLKAEVELSDTPQIEKLTLKHIQGPLVLLTASFVAATIIWLGQICHSRALKKTRGKQSKIFRKRKKGQKTKHLQMRPKPFLV